MSNTLLPCPFCGGEAFVATVEHSKENRPNGHRFHGQIMCLKCQAVCGTTGFDETYEDATEKASKAWNRRAGKDTNVTTNAQKIRSMSDEELAVWILRSVDCDKENIMCIPALYKNSDKCDGRCRDGRLSWLKQPVKEE